MAEGVTKSWFAVLANPADHGYVGTPEEVCNRLRDEWVQDSSTRTGAWAYCISADGFPHVHMVLEDSTAMRFSGVKNSYAIGAHLEPTKGTKKQAEDYIYKRPPFDEKGEQVLCVVTAGEIRGNPGARTDLQEIENLIAEGYTPQEIFDVSFSYRRYEKEIKAAYFRKRFRETPPRREIKVHYVVGESGTGKSYLYSELCEQAGEENIYMVSDYAVNGGFDLYSGEQILFMDEYKAQLSYDTLLSILDVYKKQLHARYSNIWMLWNEVYITSVYTPQEIYEITVAESRRNVDTLQQLRRRISDIIYCWHDKDGYHRRTIPMSAFDGLELPRKFDTQTALSYPIFKEAVGG